MALRAYPIKALVYFTLKPLLLCPLHAVVMRSHGRESFVVALIKETADSLDL